jgi:hypothetical protein
MMNMVNGTQLGLADEVVDVSQPTPERTSVQLVTSVLGIAVLVILAPFAILLLGLPVALIVRAVLEAIHWVSSAIF